MLLWPLTFGTFRYADFHLDAGNGRIQVFDVDGNYITQWGQKGSGEDQFDFGSGGSPEDLWGNVAVDGQGFVYVADPGNGLIKRFAPE